MNVPSVRSLYCLVHNSYSFMRKSSYYIVIDVVISFKHLKCRVYPYTVDCDRMSHTHLHGNMNQIFLFRRRWKQKVREEWRVLDFIIHFIHLSHTHIDPTIPKHISCEERISWINTHQYMLHGHGGWSMNSWPMIIHNTLSLVHLYLLSNWVKWPRTCTAYAWVRTYRRRTATHYFMNFFSSSKAANRYVPTDNAPDYSWMHRNRSRMITDEESRLSIHAKGLASSILSKMAKEGNATNEENTRANH